MADYFYELRSGVTVVGTAFTVGSVLFVGSAYLAPTVPTVEKAGAYECGSEPFDDARSRFDVRFYLVALLFIIFDLEVAFLIPVVVAPLGATGLVAVAGFLGILTLGFVYEWSQGALQWS